MRLGKRYGVKDVIMEFDSQVLINRLTKGATYLADFDYILGDIFSLCTHFNSLSWSNVKRNFVAHHLAKLVPFGVEEIWEYHFPQQVVPYVLMDTLSPN